MTLQMPPKKKGKKKRKAVQSKQAISIEAKKKRKI